MTTEKNWGFSHLHIKKRFHRITESVDAAVTTHMFYKSFLKPPYYQYIGI